MLASVSCTIKNAAPLEDELDEELDDELEEELDDELEEDELLEELLLVMPDEVLLDDAPEPPQLVNKNASSSIAKENVDEQRGGK